MRKFLKKLFEWLRILLGYEMEEQPLEPEQPPSEDAAFAPFLAAVEQEGPETELPHETREELPKYQKRASLFSYPERTFYQTLVRAVDWRQYDVFAKVRLADFIWLARQPEELKHLQARILCRHIDYLLCSKPSYAPVLVIELDDSSHKKPEIEEQDKFKNELFKEVGIPLLRVNLQKYYSREDLIKQLDECLRGSVDAGGEQGAATESGSG